ncbi:MAG TPA: ROK family protein, partial [Phycisphaerales bacterium]|nr:ROK family protein [Phycisphaerales bacterium]
MARDQFVIGVDLGGTNMQIGVVNSKNKIVGREGKKTRSAEGLKAVVDRMARGIRQACDEAEISINQVACIGVAAAGAIDIPRGVVLNAPNLKWHNAPLRAMLEKRLGRPVVIDNDVNGAVWGEYMLGAGKGRGDVLGVWLGTGVGGGLVLNGSLYYGAFFTAGEVGQTVLFPRGQRGRRT